VLELGSLVQAVDEDLALHEGSGDGGDVVHGALPVCLCRTKRAPAPSP
jgi:hypothetical protein